MSTILTPVSLAAAACQNQTTNTNDWNSMFEMLPDPRLAFMLLATILMGTQAVSAQHTSDDKVESTLGQAPPPGAVVLFDGSNFDAWKPFSWQWINPEDDQQQVQWKLVDGKAMQIAFEFNGKRQKQFLCTKEKFGDYRLHLEFQLPEDGGNGNSGIFFGPLYELQILDSSNKEEAGLGDCGAIYQIRAPDVNAGLGPGEWQTVDLEYQAAKIGAQRVYDRKGCRPCHGAIERQVDPRRLQTVTTAKQVRRLPGGTDFAHRPAGTWLTSEVQKHLGA